MKIIRLNAGRFDTNCYIIYCEEKNEGVIVDPGAFKENIINKVKELKINIKYIILTHEHFDHVASLFEVKAEFPDALLLFSHNAKDTLNNINVSFINLLGKEFPEIKGDIFLKNDDEIKFGNETLKVIETPGHTKASICLYSEGVLISGDTLFNFSMGRCDLPTGSLKEEVDSILNILFKLPGETKVFPGHGNETTIEFEKLHNEVYNWR